MGAAGMNVASIFLLCSRSQLHTLALAISRVIRYKIPMDTTTLSLSFANLLAMRAFVIAEKRYALAHEEADLPVVSQTMSAMIGLIDEINEYVPAGQA